MHRRAALAAVVLLTLLGCDPVGTPQPSTSPATGNLCERVRTRLPGAWTTEQGNPHLSAPLSDACSLVDPAKPAHRIRVMLSILPVNDVQTTAFRKADETAAAGLGYAAKITDGGVGPGSWALDPAAAAPWLVFRTDGRQIRLRVENDGAGTMAELKAIARSITELSGSLPSVPRVIARPECARGTAAAEHVLGAKAVVRRDAMVDRHLWCQWGSEFRSVSVTAGPSGSDQSIDFNAVKSGATSSTRLGHRVTVGAEGWQQNDGFLTFRTAKDQYVSIVSAPYEQMRPIPIVMLARAIEPAYS